MFSSKLSKKITTPVKDVFDTKFTKNQIIQLKKNISVEIVDFMETSWKITSKKEEQDYFAYLRTKWLCKDSICDVWSWKVSLYLNNIDIGQAWKVLSREELIDLKEKSKELRLWILVQRLDKKTYIYNVLINP